MWIAISAAAAAVLLFCFYIFALKGRTGHADWKRFESAPFAHRGLHGSGVPENSLAAFRAAKLKGYGAEFDVHILADGTLAVFHDSELKRMTGAEVKLEKLKADELGLYRLGGTNQKIPTFDEVLAVFDGGEPLVIELKTAGNNVAALCRAVCDRLDSYDGVYCIESFDPRCLIWLKKHRPDIVRGQLAENYFKTASRLPVILKFLCGNLFTNLLTRPDFVAYRFSDRRDLSFKLCRRLWRVKGVTWTLKTPEQHKAALEDGLLPIFEGYEP